MKSLRWVLAALVALVVGLTSIASAPTATAATKKYVKASVGCGYVDVKNLTSTKVLVLYWDASYDDEDADWDGDFYLGAKKSKRISTDSDAIYILVGNLKSNKWVQDFDLEVKPCVESATPSISGTARVGETLTATAGEWGPEGVTLSYQWSRSGKAVKGATAETYALTKSDLGKKITVKVTGTKDGYKTIAKTSKATAKVKAGVLTTAVPTVSGEAVVGTTLTADPGAWGPSGVKLTYSWYRSGKAVKGATKANYKLTSKDVGKTITVKVTGKLSGYTTKTVASVPTAKVAAA